jgi:hypothetical protein
VALGYPHPDYLRPYLTSKQFAEWIAYGKIEPFDERRADYRIANLMALTANVHRDPKKRRRPFTSADFMPKFGDEGQPAWQRLLEKVKHVNQIFGGGES